MRRTSLFIVFLFVSQAIAESLYDVLGVSQTATPSEIRSAYRKLALKLHPDKEQTADSTERFIKVSEAYAILSDKSKRADYDSSWSQYANDFANAWSFSLSDALDVLESTLENCVGNECTRGDGYFAESYRAARRSLQQTAFAKMPLPELLASGALLAGAVNQIDWESLGRSAKRSLRLTNEEDGSINWGRVAAAGAAGAAAFVAALDHADDGNRTSELLKAGGQLFASWLGSKAKSSDNKQHDELRR